MDGHRYIQRGISFRDEPRPPRVYAKRRRVSAEDVRMIRADYQLRRKAEAMKALAEEALRTIPTSADHAKRIGIAASNARQIASRKTYKEVV